MISKSTLRILTIIILLIEPLMEKHNKFHFYDYKVKLMSNFDQIEVIGVKWDYSKGERKKNEMMGI